MDRIEKINKSLEEAAEEYLDEVFGAGKHHQFYKDLFIAGANWQKSQILKNAEDTELYWDGDFLAIDLNMRELGYSEKDKVRIIILKEEEESYDTN